jgi:hypothetical protein
MLKLISTGRRFGGPSRMLWFLLIGAVLTVSGHAQSPPPLESTEVGLATVAQQNTKLVSPISQFRRWLSMSATDLDRDLSKRPESQRKILRAKIEEYQLMPPEMRDLRLRQVELRWYLVPLMHMDPKQRATRLSSIPAEYQNTIKERLEQWDLLPPPIQKEALESEITRNYLIRLDNSSRSEREVILTRLPMERRKEVEQELARWQSLTPRQKQTRYSRFDYFFELNPQEKQKVLNALSDEERAQMQNVLERFNNLPRAQRQHCIESFHKLASLTPEEQDQFLKNAERWQALSPADRESWREMVNALPPLPPGLFPAEPISWPPMPQ